MKYLSTADGKKDIDIFHEYDVLFTRMYGAYVRRPTEVKDKFPPDLRKYFKRVEGEAKLRVGLEFETGNIASSFRALTKLSVLFGAGQIDAGVFITSIDKPNAATRIWPTSNRNGSFQELEQRQYKKSVGLPLWEIGFAPDSFSPTAKYLEKSTLYEPAPTGKSSQDNGITYDCYVRPDGKTVLKPRVGR
jgi:hypothetical protein